MAFVDAEDIDDGDGVGDAGNIGDLELGMLCGLGELIKDVMDLRGLPLPGNPHNLLAAKNVYAALG